MEENLTCTADLTWNKNTKARKKNMTSPNCYDPMIPTMNLTQQFMAGTSPEVPKEGMHTVTPPLQFSQVPAAVQKLCWAVSGRSQGRATVSSFSWKAKRSSTAEDWDCFQTHTCQGLALFNHRGLNGTPRFLNSRTKLSFLLMFLLNICLVQAYSHAYSCQEQVALKTLLPQYFLQYSVPCSEHKLIGDISTHSSLLSNFFFASRAQIHRGTRG